MENFPFTCGICLEEGFEESEVLQFCKVDGNGDGRILSHTFCKPCFADWKQRYSAKNPDIECPVCRNVIDIFREDIPDGIHTTYYVNENEDGEKASQCTYLDGLKEGEERIWSRDGGLIERHHYKRGKRCGVSQWFREEDETLLEEVVYTERGVEGCREAVNIYRSFYNTGDLEATYEIRLVGIQGPRQEFYRSGRLAKECNMVNSAIEGTLTTWYDSSAHTVWKRETFVNGKRDGLCYEWYPSGVMQKEYGMKGFRMHGPYREWYPTGERKIECSYVGGKTDGAYREWRRDGVLMEERLFDNGRPVRREG